MPSPGILAAAITVPVTVALLASGLFLVWWYQRRARRRKASPAGSVGDNSSKEQQHNTLLGDAEGLNGHTGTRQGSDGSMGLQHPEAAASVAWTRRVSVVAAKPHLYASGPVSQLCMSTRGMPRLVSLGLAAAVQGCATRGSGLHDGQSQHAWRCGK